MNIKRKSEVDSKNLEKMDRALDHLANLGDRLFNITFSHRKEMDKEIKEKHMELRETANILQKQMEEFKNKLKELSDGR